jgi:hypothetical protein
VTSKSWDSSIAFALILYLFVVGLTATSLVALNFPQEMNDTVVFPEEGGRILFVPSIRVNSTEQALVLLAFFAGVAGSFLHTAQSLTSYIGNAQFKSSWAAWYVMRPWIGGILGFSLYFVFRAGLVAGASAVNPFGVVAIGVLGGWFSKTTTDKLQEVFETLFKTDADRQRSHKLRPIESPMLSEPVTVTFEAS